MALSTQAARRKDVGKMADMQHRHFATIATIISRMKNNEKLHLSALDVRDIAYHFAQELRATNPNFNEDRFVAACMATYGRED